MRILRTLLPLLVAAAGIGAVPAQAAEVSELKIAQQFGIGYLPLTIMKANGLVEKHLKAAGLADTKVNWMVLASGQPMNDALLSGSLHIASGGVAPFLILWDRTRGSLNVKSKNPIGWLNVPEGVAVVTFGPTPSNVMLPS